jgi:membrane-associated phospholipid phosphatase
MYNDILGFYRSIPFILPVLSILFGIIFQHWESLYFGGSIVFVDIFITKSLKNFFKILYDLIGVVSLPIIGRGIRPDGATNCGCFINPDTINQLAVSFGMPSGHSIVAGFLLSFVDIYIKENYKNNTYTYISRILLLLFCISIGLSRIVINCHTIQQVLIGLIIGYYLGFFFYKNMKYYKV